MAGDRVIKIYIQAGSIQAPFALKRRRSSLHIPATDAASHGGQRIRRRISVEVDETNNGAGNEGGLRTWSKVKLQAFLERPCTALGVSNHPDGRKSLGWRIVFL